MNINLGDIFMIYVWLIIPTFAYAFIRRLMDAKENGEDDLLGEDSTFTDDVVSFAILPLWYAGKYMYRDIMRGGWLLWYWFGNWVLSGHKGDKDE